MTFPRPDPLCRWNVVTVRGILAIPNGSVRLFLIAASLGRGFRMTFDIPGDLEPNFAAGIRGDVEGYHITPQGRANALRVASVTRKRWDNASKGWVDACMAHRCALDHITLFTTPQARCLKCRTSLPDSRETGVRSPVVRESQSRSTGVGLASIRALSSANDAEPGELQRELTEGAKGELWSGQTEGKETKGEAVGLQGSDPMHEASQFRAAPAEIWNQDEVDRARLRRDLELRGAAHA